MIKYWRRERSWQHEIRMICRDGEVIDWERCRELFEFRVDEFYQLTVRADECLAGFKLLGGDEVLLFVNPEGVPFGRAEFSALTISGFEYQHPQVSGLVLE